MARTLSMIKRSQIFLILLIAPVSVIIRANKIVSEVPAI